MNSEEVDIYRQKIETLIQLSEKAMDARLSVEYAEQAVRLADSLILLPEKGKALYCSGRAWKNLGDRLKSEERLNESRDIFLQIGSEKDVAMAERDLADNYRGAGSHDHAMIRLNKALDYFKSTSDTPEMAKTYNRMAATYFEMFYMHPDYNAFENSSNKREDFFDIAFSSYPVLKSMFDTLMFYLDQSRLFSEKGNLPEFIISTEILRASTFGMTFQNKQALDQFDKVIEKMKMLGITDDLPLVLINKARIIGQYGLKKPGEAIPLALEALKIARENNIRVYEFMANEVLHENYAALGDYCTAYGYVTGANEIFQKMKNEELHIRLQNQEFQHSLQERGRELANRRIRIWILSASIAVLVILFLVFMVILIGKNSKQKKLLDELNGKNQIISEQKNYLEIANHEKDKFFSIIAHDLKNPFSGILGFSELLKNNARQMNSKEIEEYAGLINTSATHTMQLLVNLLDWARMQQGRMKYSPGKLVLSDIVSGVYSELAGIAHEKGITLSSEIPDQLIIYADPDMFRTILRNLAGNAIKFSFPGDTVMLSAFVKSNETIVSVKDNGIGIKPEGIKKLFQTGSEFIMQGTRNEKGTGLGLIICREFVYRHGGKIWVESQPGKGSTFYISLPLEMETDDISLSDKSLHDQRYDVQ